MKKEQKNKLDIKKGAKVTFYLDGLVLTMRVLKVRKHKNKNEYRL